MAFAQRFLKVSGQCFLMDSTNTLMFPGAMSFNLIHTFRNEEFTYDTYGYNNFTHPRKGSWTGEVTISDGNFDDKFFAERTEGIRTTSTASVKFEEMYEATVAAGPSITLPSANPIAATIEIFGADNSTDDREDFVQGAVAANPNVYSIAGNVLTMPPATVVGSNYRVNYFRTSATSSSKLMFSPYEMPSAFTLYAAQAVAWAASGTKYWVVLYARSCVPTGDIRMAGGAGNDVTLTFNINNVIDDDLILWREQIPAGSEI